MKMRERQVLDRQRLLGGLKSLRHRIRVGVVAACVAEAFPIYNEWQHAATNDASNVINFLWMYAGGAGLNPNVLTNLRADISDAVPDVSEEIDMHAAMHAGVAFLYALDALSDLSGEMATRSICAVLQAKTDKDEGEDMVSLLEQVLSTSQSLGKTTTTPQELLRGG